MAEPLMGPKLNSTHKNKIMSRVVRAFSAIFWMQGCLAPQVEGFVADVKLIPGAQPRVTQPFPLSKYDQLRLEYHEDMEVAEGKAYWAPPGEAHEWGSPSFVVDQEGKGLLGRPVRDYRWPNSQTLDAGWPSPQADQVLAAAQKGQVHTMLDCIWGFTQIPLTEAASRIHALVAR